jgi:acetoin utilization deacetylase AcuC-like enzyme/GNAT superfamily N-acetyltransferase
VFRIRRVYDDVTPANKEAIIQAQNILRTQFPGLSRRDIARLPKQLRNPLKYRFRSILFVAEDQKERVRGFALLFHEPVLHFCYLDYISTAERRMGRGIGGALYERVREEAFSLGVIGLFFECLPDVPRLSPDPEVRRRNAARLRFYERYGARPIINTAYETPLRPGDTNPPFLVYDDLGNDTTPDRDTARAIIRAILERKYGNVCPRDYVEMVAESFRDDPIQLRRPRYIKERVPAMVRTSIPRGKRIALIINDRHFIHHVEERGYVESPVRIDAILNELDATEYFERVPPNHFSENRIRAVHDDEYVDYFKKVCTKLEPGQSIYPYVFPIRNAARPPKDLPIRAGYYCIDTFTPINRNAYLAARRAVDCALTGAKLILEGDIDYHHGNGQQDIFYERRDVLTISIHGRPSIAYPYFSGFQSEKGSGTGKGYNINIPLSEKIDVSRYQQALSTALKRIERFQPEFLVVALGLDTAREDPTGSWDLLDKDFEANGHMIGSLHLPTLVVQEGGYDTRVLGINARHFFAGLWSGSYAPY